MAGNSWQQPVAGEPACGTLHFLSTGAVTIRNNVDPSTSNVYTDDLSSYIPVGSKAALFIGRLSNGGGSTELFFGTSDKGKTYSRWYCPGGIYASHMAIVPVVNNTTYWWADADAKYVVIQLVGYWI